MSDYKRLEISEVIYECVSRTELQDINRESVELMLDICYSIDHDFRTETNTRQPLQQTGSDSVRNRISRAAAVCLVLLCVLLLTAVIVLCVHIHTKSTNYTEERDQLLTNITNLIEERDQLLNKNIHLKNESNGLLNQINHLIKQRDQLNQATNELKSLCEMDEWILYKWHYYFISSEKKNWTESRRDCSERGADLIIINSREEQDFVKKTFDHTRVWIGLTDSVVENTWKWVDGSTLTSGFSFWMENEPDGQRREDCVLTVVGEWADHSCTEEYNWMCEKSLM